MSSRQLPQYYTFRKIIYSMLLLLGIFPVENASLFYRSLPYIHLFLTLGTAFGMAGSVRTHITNVLAVSKRLGAMVSFLSVSLKLICMIIYYKDVMKLRKLDEHFEILINNSQFTDMVANGIAAFRRLSWTTTFFAFFCCNVNIITPIILIIYQHKHDIKPVIYNLPYLSVYPWTIPPNGFLYKFHYLFETFSTYSLIAITSSIEPLFTLYIIQMIGQLREMSHRITHFEESDDCHIVVRQCILQYETLLEYRNIIQKIFGPIMLWMIITNAVIMCLAIFQLSQMGSISVGQAIFFTTYILTKMTQTFICGWAGTRLTTESETFKEAIYASDWHENKRLMTSLTIMLSQKPLTLTACHMSIISVDIFVSVLNTTMSYFFLLQTLQH